MFLYIMYIYFILITNYFSEDLSIFNHIIKDYPYILFIIIFSGTTKKLFQGDHSFNIKYI